MTTFDDVTSSFNDALSKINSYIPKVISNFQNADSQFRAHKNLLVDNYAVQFAGMGATFFAQAVESNIQISSTLQQKLSEFAMDSDHTNKQILSINQQYNDQINNYLAPSGTAGLEHYNFTWQDVRNQLRDNTLNFYADLGDLLSSGEQILLGELDQAKADIWTQIQSLSSQIMQPVLAHYNQQKAGLDPSDHATASEYKQNYDNQVLYENMHLNEAKLELAELYKNQYSALSDWYTAIVMAIGNYNNEIAWAAATGQVSVGDLLQNLIHAPSPIVIYQTRDGGLVVAVNSMNNGLSAQQNALLVQQAIENYDILNGINNPNVTILGYKGGNDIVQALAHDNTPFQINSVVLIGAQITQKSQIGVDYVDYVAPGDNNAGTGNPSIWPQSPAEKANVAVDVGEIVLGASGGLVGVGVATGEVITSTIVPPAFTDTSGDVRGAAGANDLFDNVSGTPKPGQSSGSHSFQVVPDEPGESNTVWKLTPEFPYYKSKNVDYTQSTYLNMWALPDPKTGKPLQGSEALSAPTYFDPPSS